MTLAVLLRATVRVGLTNLTVKAGGLAVGLAVGVGRGVDAGFADGLPAAGEVDAGLEDSAGPVDPASGTPDGLAPTAVPGRAPGLVVGPDAPGEPSCERPASATTRAITMAPL